jgi:hypothetical protein
MGVFGKKKIQDGCQTVYPTISKMVNMKSEYTQTYKTNFGLKIHKNKKFNMAVKHATF